MKLLAFYKDSSVDEPRLGVSTERGVLDITAAAENNEIKGMVRTLSEVIVGGDAVLGTIQQFVTKKFEEGSSELFLEESKLRLAPCVANPSKIICIGTNYRKHAEESGMPIPKYPVLFNKFINTLAAHKQEIPLPYNAEEIDYEAELVIVIGKRAKHVTKEQALDYVTGYCIVNDLSARDLQFRTNQWLLGKSCDYFSPLGPYLVTADEIPNPNDLRIRSFVNGEIRQDSNTADMLFHCDELVSYISDYMTLEPGDIILTGTPEGVVLGYPKEERVWLKPGDEVVVDIEGLGRLRNRMAAESEICI